jgi:hypothetical protein
VWTGESESVQVQQEQWLQAQSWQVQQALLLAVPSQMRAQELVP